MLKSSGQKAAFKARLLTCGATVALVAAALTAPAFAQDAATAAAPATDDNTTVVITGIRKGIQDAISAKKKSEQIVEAVSAEDIGKLPDQSIAESIARLPGIAAQRTNGRASTLSIRGLGPDYTVTTLNGREQVSTNDNRSVEFDQYPSELISQVVVYKTPNAGMTDQGLAGTADLQTVRPIEFGKRAFAVGIRGEKNSEKAAIGGMKNTGNRYSVTYIDQFDDKKIGLALGYAHTESPYQTLKKESWGFPNYDSTHLITGGEKDAVDSSVMKRDGYMGVLEFKPNDNLHMTFDAYHSDFNELQRIARIEYPLAWGANNLEPNPTLSDTFVTHGKFDNVKAVVENYINQRKDKLNAFGWNTEYKLNDQWSLMADLSDSKVDREDVLVESTAGTGPAGHGATDTITFDQTPLGLTQLSGVVNYSDFGSVFLTDPNGWGGSSPTGSGRAGYVKTPHITDEIKSIKLSATRSFGGGFFGDVVAGFDHTDHTKAKEGKEGELWLPGNSSVQQAVIPTQFRTGTTDASFLGSTSGMVSYDSLALYQSGYFQYTEEVCQACIAKTWSVNEKIDTFYVRGDVDSTLFGKSLTGNMGLQAVHVNQKAASLYTDGTATGVAPVSGGTSYTDYLPTLNLNWHLADDTTVRLGIGTSIARPRMDDMAAGVSFGVTNDTSTPPQGITINGHPEYWSGGGGNPDLKPWKSNNFDLSVEKYFGRKGYVSAAFFYKDLNRFIYNQQVLHDFTGAPLPTNSCTAPASCNLANQYREGYLTSPANGTGGHIQGMELTASVPGEILTPWLDGFGVIVSGAFNSSEINPGGLGKIDVPGLSKEVINTTVYYEKHGFSARISNRYRGDFLGEVPDYTNSLQYQWVHHESIYDAQIGYSFQNGPLKGLSINLSGSNLNNEPFWVYQNKGHPENILRYEKYGSTYLFGVNYRY